MRKSFAVFLFIVLLGSLFIFENIYSLLKEIDGKIRQETLQQARTYADLLLPRLSDPLPGSFPYFDQITNATGAEGPAAAIIGEPGEERVVIRRKIASGRTVLFVKRLETGVFMAIRQLKSILYWMTIILALFLLVSAIYLLSILLRKKGKEVTEEELITPLQDYLIELNKNQKDLETTIQEQSQLTQKREDLSRSIISNLNQALVFVNQGGQVEMINPAAQNMFGISYSQAIHNRLEALLPAHPELQSQLENSGNNHSVQVESGGRVFFTERIPVDPHGTLFLLRDITDEINRERIQRVNTSLILLGEMTASLAHEIKNSLGVMLGYAKMMQGETDSTDRIVQQIHHLTQMMENFLNFAHPMSEPRLIPLDFGKIASEQASNQGLAIDFPSRKLTLKSDPVLLQSILLNLFINSRQAGATRITIQYEEDVPVQITIRDNGAGIPSHIDREKIWLPFFSTKENGTGMGLPLVKKLTNHLHGDIQLLESTPQGTSFHFSFFSE